MHNCHDDIMTFHNDEVILPEAERTNMRERRNTNREQMKSGLKQDGEPQPKKQQSQGSYAMRTMLQDENNDYDIDDGIFFAYEDVLGARGAELSPREVKERVRKAVHKETFKKAPEVLKNCVRVYYNEGYHVDIPVYRIRFRDNGDEYYELASTEWKEADPAAVTEWFLDENKSKSPDQEQLRRITRLMKQFGKVRGGKDVVGTGFMFSKLVVEKYSKNQNREDKALYDTMVAIRDRLEDDEVIEHPVIDGATLTKENDKRPGKLKDALSKAIDDLDVLFDSGCSPEDAMAAWDKVFKTTYFTDRLDEKNKNAKSQAAQPRVSILRDNREPVEAVNKQGGGRYA